MERVSFETPKEIYPEAVSLLISHGCVFRDGDICSEVVFPEGTTVEYVYPALYWTYKLMLPDGYVCIARYSKVLDAYVIVLQLEESKPLSE